MISQILKSKTKVLNFYLKLQSQSKNVFRNVKFENGYYGIPNQTQEVSIELKNDLPNSQLLSQTEKSIKKCL
jgi:hypothetical protein